MPTAQEIQVEQQKEAQLNNLSEKIIGMTGWGKFYPLMKLAAQMGQGAIPHQVCVSPDGRTVTVFKSDTGKIVGAFLKPQHEFYAQDISQGNFGKLALDIFVPIAPVINNVKQQKAATCITVTPNAVLALVASNPNYNPNTGQRIGTTTSGTTSLSEQINKYLTTKNILIGVGAIGFVVGFIYVIKKTT